MLVLVGVNHVSAPLPFRERLAFPDSELPAALRRLTQSGPFHEGMILSTCNRVEVLVRSADSGGVPEAVRSFLVRERQVSVDEVRRYSYHHRDKDAVRHLFHVASGLDSMILGEPQILGQVKRAYLTAHAAGSIGAVLEHLLQQGLSVAKRVRTETGISRHAVSIAFAAVGLAKKIFDDLQGRSALLLGAGKMSELAARHLASSGVQVIVSSRTYNRAAVLAEKLGGEAVNWDEALSHLHEVDIVVSGTAAAEIVLGRAQVREAIRGRGHRPMFLIDMAVPRDIDASVNELDGVYLYDIDDLQGTVDTNLEERHRAAEAARLIVEREVEAFERWRSSLDVTPTILTLRHVLHEMGEHELERFRRKLGSLTAEQQRAVQELTRSVIQKILHRPIHHLRVAAEHGDAGECTSLYREIFGIPDEVPTTDAGATEPPAEEGPPPGPRRLLPGGRED